MAKATVTVNLDAELVVEVMVLSGVRNAQDAIEVVVRDYVERGHRTEAVTGDVESYHRPPPPDRRNTQG